MLKMKKRPAIDLASLENDQTSSEVIQPSMNSSSSDLPDVFPQGYAATGTPGVNFESIQVEAKKQI